jgi:hypothetical protein
VCIDSVALERGGSIPLHTRRLRRSDGPFRAMICHSRTTAVGRVRRDSEAGRALQIVVMGGFLGTPTSSLTISLTLARKRASFPHRARSALLTTAALQCPFRCQEDKSARLSACQ